MINEFWGHASIPLDDFSSQCHEDGSGSAFESCKNFLPPTSEKLIDAEMEDHLSKFLPCFIDVSIKLIKIQNKKYFAGLAIYSN